MARYPTGDDLRRGRLRAQARDVRVRGGNPVTVSDVKQRDVTGNKPGRAMLTTLLKRGR